MQTRTKNPNTRSKCIITINNACDLVLNVRFFGLWLPFILFLKRVNNIYFILFYFILCLYTYYYVNSLMFGKFNTLTIICKSVIFRIWKSLIGNWFLQFVEISFWYFYKSLNKIWIFGKCLIIGVMLSNCIKSNVISFSSFWLCFVKIDFSY